MPRSLLFLFLPLLFCSCGYTLVGHGRTLSGSLRSIAIPIVKNRTAEPNIEITVSSVLVNEFILDGRLEVSKPTEADLLFTGSVSNYQIRPVSFDSNNNVEIYRLEIGLDVYIKESGSGEKILEHTFSGEWDFDASPDITITEPQRAAAIRSAAKLAARKVISILIEGF